MTEPSPRPWKIGKKHSVFNGWGREVGSAIDICDDDYLPVAYVFSQHNAAHIVKCVNLHEELVDGLTEYVSITSQFCMPESDADKRLNKLRKLIAKAKGEAK